MKFVGKRSKIGVKFAGKRSFLRNGTWNSAKKTRQILRI